METAKIKKTDGISFLVEIKSYENHSIQGRITWVEENRTKNFRSALELMKMMDSALPDTNDDCDFQS